jgi:hypothetical protein
MVDEFPLIDLPQEVRQAGTGAIMTRCDIKELGIPANGASGSELEPLDYNFL